MANGEIIKRIKIKTIKKLALPLFFTKFMSKWCECAFVKFYFVNCQNNVATSYNKSKNRFVKK